MAGKGRDSRKAQPEARGGNLGTEESRDVSVLGTQEVLHQAEPLVCKTKPEAVTWWTHLK